MLRAQLLVGQPLLILPVGGHAVFRRLVHGPGADLHLEGDPLPANDGGVQGLVHVGLGGADIVLESAQHRLEHVVDAAQHIVALRDVVHDDPESIQVKNLIQCLVLGEHLAVDGIGVLHPAVDLAADALFPHPLGDALLDGGQELLMGRGPGRQLVLDLLIAYRVQVAQGQVLQLPLQLLHAQAVGDGRVDLHGLQRLLPLLGGGLVFHGAHVVQPVTDLDEDHPDVLGHGHEHLPQVLHLLLFLGGVLHPGQLGHPFHQGGHRLAELLGHFFVGGVGVLNGIMEQGRDHRVRVQPQVGHDLRHRQGMGDIGGAVLAQLPLVLRVRIGKRPVQALGVQSRGIGAHLVFQRLISFQNRVHSDHLAKV